MIRDHLRHALQKRSGEVLLGWFRGVGGKKVDTLLWKTARGGCSTAHHEIDFVGCFSSDRIR